MRKIINWLTAKDENNDMGIGCLISAIRCAIVITALVAIALVIVKLAL